jgi:AcrR family transcriptional regulator
MAQIGLKNGYHHGDLKRKLLDEGLKIIASSGIEGLTLRELARRVGVTHAAPYRHFKNKAALLSNLAQEGFRELLIVLKASAEKNSDALEQLSSMAQAYVRFSLEQKAYFTVMFGVDIPGNYTAGGLEAVSRKTLDFLRNIIVDGQKENIIVAGNPERLAISTWSLAHGVTALLVEGHLKKILLSRASAERYMKVAM